MQGGQSWIKGRRKVKLCFDNLENYPMQRFNFPITLVNINCGGLDPANIKDFLLPLLVENFSKMEIAKRFVIQPSFMGCEEHEIVKSRNM